MHADLRRWVEDTTGAAVTRAERGYAGGSRELWFLEAGARSLVLRVESGTGAFHGTPLTLAREAMVCRSLRSTDVPVAEVLAATEDGSAVLMARLAGTSDLRRLDPADAAALTKGFMAALGALHRVDVDQLDIPGVSRPPRAVDHALDEVGFWDGLARERLPEPDPLLGYAAAWLRARAPTSVARTVLVQGDTGPGNFLFEGATVTGLVDWEMSHVGDPMDDLAWLDVRCDRGGPMGEPAERDALYEQASGIRVDEAAIAYYRVLVHLRCAITTAMAISGGGGALGVEAYQAPHHRFGVQLAASMAEAAGHVPVEIERPVTTGRPSRHDGAIDRARARVDAATDPSTKLAARGALLRLEHDRAIDHLGEGLDGMERRDRVETFGRGGSAASLAEVCGAAGQMQDPDVLGYLLRRAQRRLLPWATPTVGESIDPVPSPRSRA